jgi:hypothetical protein
MQKATTNVECYLTVHTKGPQLVFLLWCQDFGGAILHSANGVELGNHKSQMNLSGKAHSIPLCQAASVL